MNDITTEQPPQLKKRGRPRKNPLIQQPPQAVTQSPINQQVSRPGITRPVPVEGETSAAGSFIKLGDVVQVTSPNSIYHGALFVLGDMDENNAHGFVVLDGGQKQYLTVDIVHVAPIGKAVVRSRTPCSQQWLTDHNKTQPNEQENQTPIRSSRGRS